MRTRQRRYERRVTSVGRSGERKVNERSDSAVARAAGSRQTVGPCISIATMPAPGFVDRQVHDRELAGARAPTALPRYEPRRRAGRERELAS